MAFRAPKHEGSLGKSFSMLTVSTMQVAVKAMKQAELTEETVIRVQELFGKDASEVKVKFPAGILSAREVNGIEETVGEAFINNGQLVFNLKPYQPKTFAVKIGKPAMAIGKKTSRWLALNYDIDGVSFDGNRTDGDFDGNGNTFPAELWPSEIVSSDVVFKMGSAAEGQNNFMSSRGQVIDLPEGRYNTVYILASSADMDRIAEFRIDGKPVKVNIPFYSGNIGQWDKRDFRNGYSQAVRINGVVHPRPIATIPAFIKHVPVGFVATHRHLGNTNENEAYVFGYLFRLEIEIPVGAKILQLPDRKEFRIAAVTVSDDANRLSKPAGRLGMDFPRDSSGALETAAKINEPVSFEGVKPLPAHKTDIAKLNPGLNWAYYEGRWGKLPDWSKLTPVKSGNSLAPELPAGHRPEFFGVVYDGYIRIPESGAYTFFTTSDDGSAITLDDVLITDNDGAHGETEEAGYAMLDAGLHRIRLQYYNGAVDYVFRVAVEGPGLQKQTVPKDWWRRD
jgi:hypothetical protein